MQEARFTPASAHRYAPTKHRNIDIDMAQQCSSTFAKISPSITNTKRPDFSFGVRSWSSRTVATREVPVRTPEPNCLKGVISARDVTCQAPCLLNRQVQPRHTSRATKWPTIGCGCSVPPRHESGIFDAIKRTLRLIPTRLVGRRHSEVNRGMGFSIK